MWQRLDRVAGGGFLLICVDIKYNQITPPLAQYLARSEVKAIQLVRKSPLAHYFSGRLHTWRGENPDRAATGEVPVYRFVPYVYAEQKREVLAFLNRFSWLAGHLVTYEGLTAGEDIRLMPARHSKALCEFLDVEEREMTTDFEKEAPPDYLAHLRGVPPYLARQQYVRDDAGRWEVQ